MSRKLNEYKYPNPDWIEWDLQKNSTKCIHAQGRNPDNKVLFIGKTWLSCFFLERESTIGRTKNNSELQLQKEQLSRRGQNQLDKMGLIDLLHKKGRMQVNGEQKNGAKKKRKGKLVVRGPLPLASSLLRVLLLSGSGYHYLASSASPSSWLAVALSLLCYLPHLPHLLCSSFLTFASLV